MEIGIRMEMNRNEPIRIELPTATIVAPVNVFLIKSPEPTLIDCGMYTPDAWKSLKKGLRQNGVALKDLRRVIVTHSHVDHLGMAGKIAKTSGATIWVNDQCYPFVTDMERTWNERITLIEKSVNQHISPTEMENSFGLAFTGFLRNGKHFWTTIPKAKIRRYASDGSLVFGDLQWEVMYLPGHSTTQTCFYQKEKKWFIAADALLPLTATPAIEPSLENPEKRSISLPVMIKSLERIKALDIENVYPGHGPVFQNHRKLIDYQLARIQMRKNQVFDLIKNGNNRFFDLFRILYENQINIMGISMLVGYLDLLLLEKKIEENMKDGYIEYRL